MKHIPIHAVQRGLITMDELGSSEFRSFFTKLMNRGALCLGPSNAVPENLMHFVSPLTDEAHFYLRGKDAIVRGFLNSCRHREFQLITPLPETKEVSRQYSGRLTSESIVCPAHNWRYSSSGDHEFSPALGFEHEKCLALHEVPVKDIGGLYWSGSPQQQEGVRELLNLPIMREHGITQFIPSDYMLHKVGITEEDFTPEDAIELFVEVDHVDDDAIHGGTFNQLVVTQGLDWGFGMDGSVQALPWRVKHDENRITPEYRGFKEAVLHLTGGKTPPFGAIWIAHYPDGTTIEIFPFAIVVSRFAPIPGTNKTQNVCLYFYPEEVIAFDDYGLTESHSAAYLQSAHEDRLLCNGMGRGRSHLRNFGVGHLKSGPIHPHEEAGVAHYFKYIHDEWSVTRK